MWLCGHSFTGGSLCRRATYIPAADYVRTWLWTKRSEMCAGRQQRQTGRRQTSCRSMTTEAPDAGQQSGTGAHASQVAHVEGHIGQPQHPQQRALIPAVNGWPQHSDPLPLRPPAAVRWLRQGLAERPASRAAHRAASRASGAALCLAVAAKSAAASAWHCLWSGRHMACIGAWVGGVSEGWSAAAMRGMANSIQ